MQWAETVSKFGRSAPDVSWTQNMGLESGNEGSCTQKVDLRVCSPGQLNECFVVDRCYEKLYNQVQLLKMPTVCIVWGCTLVHFKGSPTNFLHLPKDEKCREKWIEVNCKTGRVCSLHLDLSAYEIY